MSCVPARLREDVDHHVEQLHVGLRPPGHVARSVDGQCVDRRVRMRTRSLIAVDDVATRLLGSGPHVVAGPRGRVVPARHGLGSRPIEDLAEVPGLRCRQVLHEAEQVRAGRGEWTTDVVFGEAIELRQQRLSVPPERVVEVLLRELIDHATALSPRYWSRDERTQNSLPSGSASTSQLSSPVWPTSTRVAPSASRRSISASRSSSCGARGRCAAGSSRSSPRARARTRGPGRHLIPRRGAGRLLRRARCGTMTTSSSAS